MISDLFSNSHFAIYYIDYSKCTIYFGNILRRYFIILLILLFNFIRTNFFFMTLFDGNSFLLEQKFC